jgi:hypothetical protein
MNVIEFDELGKLKSFEVVDLRTDQLNSFVVEFFTTGKKNSTDVTLTISQKNCDFLISDRLSTGEMSQVSQLVNEKVDPDIRNKL